MATNAKKLFIILHIFSLLLIGLAFPSARQRKPSSNRNSNKLSRSDSLDSKGYIPYQIFRGKERNDLYAAYLTTGNIITPNNRARQESMNVIQEALKGKGFVHAPGTTIIKGRSDGVRLDSQSNVSSRHQEPFLNLQLQQNGIRKPGHSTTYAQVYAPVSFLENKEFAAAALQKSLDTRQNVNVRRKNSKK